MTVVAEALSPDR